MPAATSKRPAAVSKTLRPLFEATHREEPAAREGQAARAIAEIGVSGNRQRPGAELGAAGIGIDTRQHQRAGAGLGQRLAVPTGRWVRGLVMQRRADLKRVGGGGQREDAGGEMVAGGPAQVIARQILPAVVGLAGVEREVVDRPGKAADRDGAEVAADAGVRRDQHLVQLAWAVDAGKIKGDAVAERQAVGLQRGIVRGGDDR